VFKILGHGAVYAVTQRFGWSRILKLLRIFFLKTCLGVGLGIFGIQQHTAIPMKLIFLA